MYDSDRNRIYSIEYQVCGYEERIRSMEHANRTSHTLMDSDSVIVY